MPTYKVSRGSQRKTFLDALPLARAETKKGVDSKGVLQSHLQVLSIRHQVLSSTFELLLPWLTQISDQLVGERALQSLNHGQRFGEPFRSCGVH